MTTTALADLATRAATDAMMESPAGRSLTEAEREHIALAAGRNLRLEVERRVLSFETPRTVHRADYTRIPRRVDSSHPFG